MKILYYFIPISKLDIDKEIQNNKGHFCVLWSMTNQKPPNLNNITTIVKLHDIVSV